VAGRKITIVINGGPVGGRQRQIEDARGGGAKALKEPRGILKYCMTVLAINDDDDGSDVPDKSRAFLGRTTTSLQVGSQGPKLWCVYRN
jgi:hypothetical protein